MFKTAPASVRPPQSTPDTAEATAAHGTASTTIAQATASSTVPAGAGHNQGTRPAAAPGTTRADRRDRDCMNETCDRCGPAVRAVSGAESTGELYLCRHCGNRLEPALHARGWTMALMSEHALARQAT